MMILQVSGPVVVALLGPVWKVAILHLIRLKCLIITVRSYSSAFFLKVSEATRSKMSALKASKEEWHCQVLTKLTAKFLTVFCRRQKVGWVQALSIVIL